MARGDRRSLVSFHPDALGEELLSRLAETSQGAVEVMERLAGKRTPWFGLPYSVREAELEELRALSAELVANSDVVLVLGSGDLEAAARAPLEALAPPREERRIPLEFVSSAWAGPSRLPRLLDWLGSRRVCLLLLVDGRPDPAMAVSFRLLWQHILDRHGPAEARRRIVVAAASSAGPFHEFAEAEEIRLLAPATSVPRRYSAFTPAGLLPAAAGGLDPARLVEGARSQGRSLEGQEPGDCPSLQYAAVRGLLAQAGRSLEAVASADPALGGILGEAERLLSVAGSSESPLPMPLRMRLPEALHVRQSWLESGVPACFATFLGRQGPAEGERQGDGPSPGWESLGDLCPSTLVHRVESAAAEALGAAQVPVLNLRVPRLDSFHVGALLFFLQCARGLTTALFSPGADSPAPPAGEELLARSLAGAGGTPTEPAVEAV